MVEELGIRPSDIRGFLADAKEVLKCNRVKTSHGNEISHHWFYLALQHDSQVVPTIVVIEVRRTRRELKVFLTDVRAPTDQELTEIGATIAEPVEETFPTREATRAILELLREAKNKPRQSKQDVCRRLLAYDGSPLTDEYVMGPWSIFPARESHGRAHISEKIICCDRLVAGRDAFEIIAKADHHLHQLAPLLTVFWTNHFYEIRPDSRWTIEPYDESGQTKLKNRLVQLGYSTSVPSELIVPAENGRVRSLDRLDVMTWVDTVGNPFRPPDDAAPLFELFEQADMETAQRFLEAAKAYHIAHAIASETTTGAISYLVVAAEALIDAELPRCPECKQVRGVSKAFRDVFFTELPCLLEDEQKAKRLLDRAYKIRSGHFHDARFLAGELEEWQPPDILMPDPMAYREIHGRLLALVNGLIIAYLTRRVTGAQWPRALGAFPDWREPKYFSVSVTLGATADEAKPAQEDSRG